MYLELGLLGVALTFFYFASNLNGKRKNYPNGPTPLPVIGNLHQIGSEPYKRFMEWTKEYGNIFSIKFASYDVVLLNNFKDIKDALAESAFSGRPNFPGIIERMGGVRRGIVLNQGHGWTEQRRFALKTLRDFGFGKKSVENIIRDEINELIYNFKKLKGKPMHTHNKFNAAVLNALWTMVTGQRYSHDDPMLQDLTERMTSTITRGKLALVINLFPVLYNLWNKLNAFFKYESEDKESHRKNLNFVNKAIKEHQQSFLKEAEPRDFIDVYLKEIEKTVDKDSSFYKEEGILNLGITLMDLFLAGAETTSTALSWEFLLMAMHPDVQEKLHQEIQNIVGLNRLPSLNDRPMMPYTEAVINEVMRFSSMVPMSATHRALEDTVFRGYHIPKGTLIMPNLYSAMHDPEVWGDPDVFRPERFLSGDEKSVVKHDAFMPFSTGRRICLGITLAQDELFLFTTSLFQRFKVGPDPNGEKLKIDYFASSVLVPKPQDFVLQDRMEEY